jgi:hypothetical protein
MVFNKGPRMTQPAISLHPRCQVSPLAPDSSFAVKLLPCRTHPPPRRTLFPSLRHHPSAVQRWVPSPKPPTLTSTSGAAGANSLLDTTAAPPLPHVTVHTPLAPPLVAHHRRPSFSPPPFELDVARNIVRTQEGHRGLGHARSWPSTHKIFVLTNTAVGSKDSLLPYGPAQLSPFKIPPKIIVTIWSACFIF